MRVLGAHGILCLAVLTAASNACPSVTGGSPAAARATSYRWDIPIAPPVRAPAPGARRIAAWTTPSSDAVIVLAAAVLPLVVYPTWYWLRSPHGFRLAMLELGNEWLCRMVYRFRRIGPCTVPRHGPVIIAANHTSSVDPLFLCAGCPYRRVAFLIAAEYADLPIARIVIRLLECIPVRRDGKDVAAAKEALRRLHRGGAVGIFMEGRILPPDHPPDWKEGVALLALRSRAPVIPAHISGTKHREGVLRGFLTLHRARVRFGEPVDLRDLFELDGRDAVAEAARRIHQAIQALNSNQARLDDPVP